MLKFYKDKLLEESTGPTILFFINFFAPWTTLPPTRNRKYTTDEITRVSVEEDSYII